MADNVTLNIGSGGDVTAADEIGGVKWQRVKMTLGADGVNDLDVSSANPMPVLGIGSVTETAPASDTASSGLNGRMQRTAQNLTTINTTLGTKTSSVTPLETGGVGVVGWLSQIWRDLGLMSAKLPASLGRKGMAASISTVAASGTPTSRSGTITAGGAAQNVAAANADRLGWSVQNNSTGDVWVNELATAVQSQPSFRVLPGQTVSTQPGEAGAGAISIIGATTGQAFTAREW